MTTKLRITKRGEIVLNILAAVGCFLFFLSVLAFSNWVYSW